MRRPRKQDTICAISGCDEIAIAWNRCDPHYREWRKANTDRWPLEHGTTNTYRNYQCRCHECREANTVYHRKDQKKIGVGPRKEDAIDAPAEFHQRLKQYAEHKGKSIRSVALEAIEEYMKRNP